MKTRFLGQTFRRIRIFIKKGSRYTVSDCLLVFLINFGYSDFTLVIKIFVDCHISVREFSKDNDNKQKGELLFSVFNFD